MGRRISDRNSFFGPSWHLGKVLENLDSYALPIPSFNLQGETSVKTLWGGLWTFAVLTFAFMYAGFKLTHLASKKNPTIIETEVSNYVDNNTMIPYKDLGFKAAFGLYKFFSGELVDDPRYVKWIVRHRGMKNGKEFERVLPVHKCTYEELSKFNPV